MFCTMFKHITVQQNVIEMLRVTAKLAHRTHHYTLLHPCCFLRTLSNNTPSAPVFTCRALRHSSSIAVYHGPPYRKLCLGTFGPETHLYANQLCVWVGHLTFLKCGFIIYKCGGCVNKINACQESLGFQGSALGNNLRWSRNRKGPNEKDLFSFPSSNGTPLLLSVLSIDRP